MAESMRDRMGKVVCDLLETDPHTALVLADISTDYFRDVKKKYPNRVVNVGIMEQTAVSVAAGFAMEGFHPIVHSITPFVVERPFEQIKDDLCYQGLGGTLISIGASYDYGTDGMTHYGAADVPILKTLPRMQCCVPGTADEFESLLRQTYANGAPTYLRTSIRQNISGRPVSFGKLHIEREGSQGIVVAVGPMLDRTLEAIDNFDVAVLYATRSPANVIVVEPYYEGGLMYEIARTLQAAPARIEAIGVPHRIIRKYGPPEQLDQAVGLTVEGIRGRVSQFLNIGS
jgi:transketolase